MAGGLEEPAHEVLATHDGFEVRRYAPTVQARVQKAGPGQGSDGSAFRRVAGYIFGGNDAGMRIAMTAPVHLWEEDSASMLAFTMPSEHALDALPTPRDAGVHLLDVEAHTVAVLAFSGLSRPAKVARLAQRLQAMVEAEGYEASGPYRLAVYDNPGTTLPFMRRNEIHLPLASGEVGHKA